VDGKSFVTARGWSDLSDMMKLYEEHDITIDEKLIVQYLQNKKIAKNFAIYYDLFTKYKSDYQVDQILAGKSSEAIKDRAKVAKFDERLALLGLLLDGITERLKAVNLTEQSLTELLSALKNVRMELARPQADAVAAEQRQIENLRSRIQKGKLASTMSVDAQYACHGAIAILEEMVTVLYQKAPADGTAAFKLLKSEFDKKTKALKKQAADAGKQLSNVFVFCEEVFGDGQEMLILVTELTISYYGAHFISRYGCKEYFNHNKELLFYERQKEIIQELEELELEE
jgi:hypothetical protein